MSKIRNWAVAGITALALAGGTAALAAGPASASVTKPVQINACTQVFHHDVLTLTASIGTFNYDTRLTLTPVRGFFGQPTGVWVISGTLCDKYLPTPTALPVHGILFNTLNPFSLVGSIAVFSVNYGTGTPQGVRTFSGVVGGFPFLADNGSVSETGPEALVATFALARI
jgi:hypothetical protein